MYVILQIEIRKKILNWLVKTLITNGAGGPDLRFYISPASHSRNHSREAN
jgi:hypothetical protein